LTETASSRKIVFAQSSFRLLPRQRDGHLVPSKREMLPRVPGLARLRRLQHAGESARPLQSRFVFLPRTTGENDGAPDHDEAGRIPAARRPRLIAAIACSHGPVGRTRKSFAATVDLKRPTGPWLHQAKGMFDLIRYVSVLSTSADFAMWRLRFALFEESKCLREAC